MFDVHEMEVNFGPQHPSTHGVLRVLLKIDGARLTLNCMRIGGMPVDLPPGWLDDLEAFLGKFEAAVDEYEALLTNNRIWKRRTIGIGVVTPEEAIAWGITGPPLRGCGVEWDLGRAQPYECYPDLQFE